MEYDMRDLAAPLPEEITKLKWGGDFEGCIEAIERRLSEARTPEVLRRRLLLERELVRRIPAQYPYDYEEMLRRMQLQFRDFRKEELDRLRAENACDWIFRGGKVYFSERALENVLKTRADYAARSLTKEEEEHLGQALLRENMREMKERGERRMRLKLRTILKPGAAAAERLLGQDIRVYMPLPVCYRQVKNCRILRLHPEPIAVAGEEFPQRTAVFETRYTGIEQFETEVTFEALLRYNDPKPEAVSAAQPSFYTQEELPHIRFTPYLRRLTKEVVGTETNPLKIAWRIYDYITSHVMYSFVRSYSTIYDIPEYAASNLKGDCGFQALLFITMCRCAGVPARWQSGLYANPHDIGAHDWAEYYVAPYGWLFADCSFGGSAYREGDEERRAFYRCNLDPYRVPYASEFQHPFVLPCGALRNDPYDNQVGEIICGEQALLYGETEVSYTLETEDLRHAGECAE